MEGSVRLTAEVQLPSEWSARDLDRARAEANRALVAQAEERGLVIVDTGYTHEVVNPDMRIVAFRGTAAGPDCAICGKRLSQRSHRLDRGGWAHGPCKGFDEQRIAEGFPDAKDAVELRRLVRIAEARNE